MGWSPGGVVAYTPIRLLVAYDPAGGLCRKVIPQMKQLLEERAFEVDVVELGQPIPDLAPYRGLVLGCAVRGLGLDGLRGRGTELPEAFRRFVEETPDLEEKKVALFAVCALLPGQALLQMRSKVEARGAQVVVAQPYRRFGADPGVHVLPAECMVRIRR